MANSFNFPSLSGVIKDGVEGLGKVASDIIKDFKADPNKVLDTDLALKELENKIEETKNTLTIALAQEESKQLETVNQTIREEGKSEHWAVWLWRPFIGFTFCAILVNNYIIIPYFQNLGLKLIDIPETIWTAMLVILGAASATRGWEQVEKAKKEKQK